jgi:hypothetical protein
MTLNAGLEEKRRGLLDDLLYRCVVRIQAGATTGTGFFITPRQVMTCRHVVAGAIGGAAAISVTGFLGGTGEPASAPATISDVLEEDWPDIAILSLAEGAAESCVMLDADEIPDGTSLMSGGYPAKAAMAYQAQRFTAGFAARGEGQARELRIEGDLVKDGMSGSPVVSLRSGLVVGILRITKGTGTLGGFSTLFTDVMGKFPTVQSLVDRPPLPAVSKWIAAVGGLNLRNAGRAPTTGARWSQTSVMTRIDLTVEQDATAAAGTWHVGVQDTRGGNAGATVPRSTADLGDGVMRAVDGWSRRQMITRPEEVQALGRVLDRALLAGAARTAVDDAGTMPPFLLRVCVDKAGGLSQLPWEYATGDDAVPLSVNENLAFVRFVDAPGTPPPPQDQLRVLGVIEIPAFQPAEFRDYEDDSGQPIQPSEQEFLQYLSDTFANKRRVYFEPAVNMAASDLKDKLSDGWDVVHYLGFAWTATGGSIRVSVGCEKRARFSPISLTELRDDYLSLAQCPVFVAEFHRPPLRPDLAPPNDPGAFTALLQGAVQAIVVTQHPADLVDLGRFNDNFYEKISKGYIVELAVQAGRRAVQAGGRPDITAFGSFTVTTRQAGEIRLLKPLTPGGGAGNQSGPPGAAAAGRSAVDTAANVQAGD